MYSESYAALDFYRNAFVLIPENADDDCKTVLIPGTGRKKQRLFCSCSRGRTPTCSHAKILTTLYNQYSDSLEGTVAAEAFEASFFRKLLAVFSRVRPFPLHRCAGDVANDVFTVSFSDVPVWTCYEAGDRIKRFSGRISPGIPYSRAWLMNQSVGLVESEYERMMRSNETLTVRQREEECFWYRAAYHCFREYQPEKIIWDLTVDTSGAVLLRASYTSGKLFSITVPPKAVPGVIGVLRQSGQVSKQWMYLDKEVELYFTLSGYRSRGYACTPVVVLPGGRRHQVEKKYCFETVGYLPDAGCFVRFTHESLQKIATGWGEVKHLSAKALSGFLEMHTGVLSSGMRDGNENGVMQGDLFGAVGYDDFGRLSGVELVTSFDNIELHPQSVEEDTWTIQVLYRSGGNSIRLNDMQQARKRNDRYLLYKKCIVDLKAEGVSDALAHARGVHGNGVVTLSNISLLMLRGTRKTLELKGEEGLTRRIRKLFDFTPDEALKTPVGLQTTLREYQFNGVAWMLFLYDNHLGGLLCDDMGLGKTIQMIALMLAVREQRETSGVFLVVCPTSVISHWIRLTERFAPELSVCEYHGGSRQLPESESIDVLVTSYGILRNDLDLLRQRQFAIAVFDEIQHCKNAQTNAHKAASEITGKVKIGLTGTPVENSIAELKSLFNLVTPGLLDELPPEEMFLNSMESGGENGVLRQFKKRTEPFILRRLKSSVLTELPEKIEEDRICSLSPHQREIYREAVIKRGGPLIAALKDSETPVPYMHIFSLLNFLKQVCNSTALAAGRWEEYAEHESGKFELFKELLDESIGSGQKVVVFTQYLGMVEIFNHYLAQTGIGSVCLTGKTRNRREVLRRFADDDDCRVFVGSIKAGGVGIDLVAASVVIHYDRWWNAAKEDQATDRVHRMGQTRGVQVFKLVTEDTIEERIAGIIERKRELARATLSEDDPDSIKQFSREELVKLLSV